MTDTKESKIITYNEVMEQVKNIPLEQMSKSQLFNRYVAYGTEEELNTPNIQKALLQHGYIKELFEMINFITDKQVISDILHKYLRKIPNTIIIFGKAKEMFVIEHLKEPKEKSLSFEFIDTDTNETVLLNGPTLFTQADYDKYKNDFFKYKDNLIAIVQKTENKYKLLCFLVRL